MSEVNINQNLAKIVHRVLTDRRGWRVDALVSELGIQDRTYRKYRKILKSEFPPFQTKDGKCLLAEVKDGEASYLRLVDAEELAMHDQHFVSRVAALYFAQQLLGFVDQTPIGVATNDLISEFRARLTDQPFLLQHVLGNTDRMFFQLPDAPKDYGGKKEVLQAILNSLVFRRKARMVYDSASHQSLELIVAPYTLAVFRSALYLIAKGSDDEVRIYAVDRITSYEGNGSKFNYPSREEFDPRRYTEGSFGIFRSDSKKLIEFELLFVNERWLKLYITERRWHPTQKFENLKDGRLRMTFKVNTDVEVWPWIRQFGDNVQVVKPKPSS